MKKIQIRAAAETNSSSTHAVVIIGLDIDNIILPETLLVSPGDFGWEDEKYTSPEHKISYLVTALLNNYSQDKAIKIFLSKVDTLLASLGIQLSYSFISPVNGRFETFDIRKGELPEPHYATCGSMRDASGVLPIIEELLDDEILLLNFLFNTNSFIQTERDDSDSDSIYDLVYGSDSSFYSEDKFKVFYREN